MKEGDDKLNESSFEIPLNGISFNWSLIQF